MQVLAVKQDEAQAILAKVRTNQARLEGCVPHHRFTPIGEVRLGGRWRCERCGGDDGPLGVEARRVGARARASKGPTTPRARGQSLSRSPSWPLRWSWPAMGG